MPRICVCVEPLFGDASLAEKARRVAKAGFRAIEFYDAPGDRDLDALAAVCREEGLLVNDIVVNAPDGSVGGALVSPADRGKYLARLRELMGVARKLDCRKLITCSGNSLGGALERPAPGAGSSPPGMSRVEQRRAMVQTLKEAAAVAAQQGFTLLLEPLNTLVDHPGYYLDSGHEAAEIVQEVDSPGLRLLWDIYHMQIMHGNVLANIERYLPLIGHFHSAGVPGRHELDNGELAYGAILSRIASWSYQGCFGLEYLPVVDDHAYSLARMRELTAAAGWE